MSFLEQFKRKGNPEGRIELFRYMDTSHHKPFLDTFYVIKQTPQGWWISDDSTGDMDSYGVRWTSNKSTRRYAYESKKEAFISYKARKRMHLLRLELSIKSVKKMIEWIKFEEEHA